MKFFTILALTVFSINAFSMDVDNYIDQIDDYSLTMDLVSENDGPQACKDLSISQDQIEQVKLRAKSLKRFLIQAKADLQLAMFDYGDVLNNQKSNINMAQQQSSNVIEKGTVIVNEFFNFGNEVLFNIFGNEQRPKLLKCMKQVKKMKKRKKACKSKHHHKKKEEKVISEPLPKQSN